LFVLPKLAKPDCLEKLGVALENPAYMD